MNGKLDLRWADTGSSQQGGWSIAWAQLIGVHHPSLTEDSVAYRYVTLRDASLGVCLAVADGVGGGARGDVASDALVKHWVQAPGALLGDEAGLAAWTGKADGDVQLRLRQVSNSPGAAVGVAGWFRADGNGHITRFGDARAYCFTKADNGVGTKSGVLTQLTNDQTYAYVNEMPPEGGSPDDPARMVGTGCMGEPELQHIQVDEEQILLLCSDGLHRGVSAEQIAFILSSTADLDEASRKLASAARAGGSSDDITVLLMNRLPHVLPAPDQSVIRQAQNLWQKLLKMN